MTYFLSHQLQNYRLLRQNLQFTATTGKLFYFSSKVTTFEHTYCAW